MERTPTGPSESIDNNIEKFNERVGRITLFRHGDTLYTNKYPDLTDAGKRKLHKEGSRLVEEVDQETEDVLFLHSPSVRAKTSMAFLLKGMGITEGTSEREVEEHARPLKPLRSVGHNDYEKAMELVGKYVDLDDPKSHQHKKFDRVYVLDPAFEESEHWEPRSQVEARGKRVLRQGIYLLIENHTSKDTDKTPHIVAVSHFETLNVIAAEIFDLDPEHDALYARGEKLSIEVKTDGNDTERVLLSCTFRNETKMVWYELKTGAITKAE